MKYSSSPEEDKEFLSSPFQDCTNRLSKRKTIRKRKRKSLNQLEILSQEFATNSEWDKQQISRLMKKTGLTEAQIYKWGWDQKKKMFAQEKNKILVKSSLCDIFASIPENKFLARETPKVELGILSCSEALLPQVIDFHFYKLQKSYKDMADEFRFDSTYKKNLTCLFDTVNTIEI
jgi:hypothetical protein